MDPPTTLYTFLLETHPAVHSVSLIGSWDNFTSLSPMQLDKRRGPGQWKGCFPLQNVDDRNMFQPGTKRNRGLTMGQTYYYYYELNGSSESHNNFLPTTTACPYLPGQKVNLLEVPMERSLRQRSASLSSMRGTDFMTQNPADKFISPRRAPLPPSETLAVRSTTAHTHTRTYSSPRAASPSLNASSTATPAWKRIFARRGPSADRGRGRSPSPRKDEQHEVVQAASLDASRNSSVSARSRASSIRSEGTRSRDISPESLRRFLSSDAPDSRMSERPSLTIPEDIVEEHDEDDENFATSATAALQETSPMATVLSPPPFKRAWSEDTVPLTITNLSNLTLATERPKSRRDTAESTEASTAPAPYFSTTPSDMGSFFSQASSAATPASPRSPGELQSFYDDSVDDGDFFTYDGEVFSATAVQLPTAKSSHRPSLSAYRLPQIESCAKFEIHCPDVFPVHDSRSEHYDAGVKLPINDFNLEGFRNELNWMASSIFTSHK